MTDERAVRLALDAGRANLRIAELEDERAGLREYVDRLILAADSRENQIAEAWDEVERLRGLVERLELEKFDLTERLIQMGSDPS